MRYISTRGEAPSLDFVDVMLAGLARDGGLYVPERWPTLDRAIVGNFAGKPYAEVAVEVIRPFVGDGIAEADLARMAREAYGNFRHPAVAPLTQLDPRCDDSVAIRPPPLDVWSPPFTGTESGPIRFAS